MKCNSCGYHNEDNAKYCKKCGRELSSMVKRYCEACGKQLTDGAKYCKYCGGVVKTKNEQLSTEISEKKTKTKKNVKAVAFFIIMIVALIVVIVVMSQKKLLNGDNFENQDFVEEDDSNNTYNDTQDELLDENIDEDDPLVDENSVDSQNDVDERGSYRQNVSVEENVLTIREKYNEIVSFISSGEYVENKLEDSVTGYYDGNELKAIIVSRGANGIEYTQSYYYDEGNLIFAYYENEDSHRFYFYEEYLMRWRYCADANNSSDAINYDWDSSEEYIEWEKIVLDASNAFLNK